MTSQQEPNGGDKNPIAFWLAIGAGAGAGLGAVMVSRTELLGTRAGCEPTRGPLSHADKPT